MLVKVTVPATRYPVVVEYLAGLKSGNDEYVTIKDEPKIDPRDPAKIALTLDFKELAMMPRPDGIRDERGRVFRDVALIPFLEVIDLFPAAPPKKPEILYVILVNGGDYPSVGPFPTKEAAEKHLEENGWKRRGDLYDMNPQAADFKVWSKERFNGLNTGFADIQPLFSTLNEMLLA